MIYIGESHTQKPGLCWFSTVMTFGWHEPLACWGPTPYSSFDEQSSGQHCGSFIGSWLSYKSKGKLQCHKLKQVNVGKCSRKVPFTGARARTHTHTHTHTPSDILICDGTPCSLMLFCVPLWRINAIYIMLVCVRAVRSHFLMSIWFQLHDSKV